MKRNLVKGHNGPLHVMCNSEMKIKASPSTNQVQPLVIFNRAEWNPLSYVLFCINTDSPLQKTVQYTLLCMLVQCIHISLFMTQPFIFFLLCLLTSYCTTGVTQGEMQMIPSSTSPTFPMTPITLLWLQKQLSSNSHRETQSFTTAPSSILSGFKWIKGKVKQ